MIKNIKRLLFVLAILSAICFCFTIKTPEVRAENAQITLGGKSIAIAEDDYFVRSVAIRLDVDENNGIRFKTVIKKSLYNEIEDNKTEADDVVYGILLIPAYRVEGGELTVNTVNVTNETLKDVFKTVWYDEIEYKEGCIYVYDILREHQTDDIMVRCYVEINGNIVYYSPSKQISMAEVAYKEVGALNDGTSVLPSESKDKDYYIDRITKEYLTYYATCYYEGEEIGKTTIIYGEKVGSLDFTKKGHSLQGVYSDSGKSVPFTATEKVLKGGDTSIYADFSKNTYKLKVNYLPATDDGLDHFIQVVDNSLKDKEVESVERDVLFGDSYDVTNPVLDGYSTVSTSVSGSMDDEGKEITVYYTRNSYNFTVSHQNANGVFKTETKSVKYGESLSGVSSQEKVSSIIDVSSTAVNSYMSSSDSAVTYTYSFKSGVGLNELEKAENVAIFTKNDDISITFTHTGSDTQFARMFKIGDVMITNGIIVVYTDTNHTTQIYRIDCGLVGDGDNYNYSSLVPQNDTYKYEFVLRSSGDIEWYREGVGVLRFPSSANCSTGDKTVAWVATHIREQLDKYGIEVMHGDYTDPENVKHVGTVSAVSMRITPSSNVAYLNYEVSGDSAHPNNASYVILNGYSTQIDVKMPGYTYTSTGTVANDKLNVVGGNTYTINYTRQSDGTDFDSGEVNKHIVRIGQNIGNTAYVYGIDKIEGNFYLEFHLQDIFMMMSDHSSNDVSVTRRTPIIQITDSSDYNRWRRFFLDNHTEASSSVNEFGDITASNDWWGSGDFNKLYNNRLSCYVKVIRQNSLIQVTYYVTVEGGTSYSFNYRMENVNSTEVNVSLDAYDSAFKIDWTHLEDSVYDGATKTLNERKNTDSQTSGYYNFVYFRENRYGSNYAWNNWGDKDHVNIYGFNMDSNGNGQSAGTGDFDWSFSYYSWGCDGLDNSCNWDQAKSTAPILFMLQNDSNINKTNVYNTYYKAFVTCHYDTGTKDNHYPAAGENWFVDENTLGITANPWKNVNTKADFDTSSYSPYEIYIRAYVYYRIKRVGGTVTVTQIYVPIALRHEGDTISYNNDQTQFTKTVKFTNVYTDRDSSKGNADLYICIAALHGGMECSGAWDELQDTSKWDDLQARVA